MILAAIIMVGILPSCQKIDESYIEYKNELKEFSGTAIEYFKDQPAGTYDSLLLALDRCPELKQVMGNDTVTVFALSNRSFQLAFENLNKARADSVPLLPPVSIQSIDDSILQVYLSRYVIRDKFLSKDIAVSSDGLRVATAVSNYYMHMQYVSTNASGVVGGGPKSLLFSDTNNSLDINNWTRVGTTTVDILTKNAVINYLPANHIFGFGADFIITVNKIR